MSGSHTTLAPARHAEYLAEVSRLVHDQVDALYAVQMAVIERLPASNAVATRPTVTHGDRVIRVALGRCSVDIEARATSDLPEGASRAQIFPTGPAWGTARAPDGIIARWELRPVHADNASPGYAWMVARTEIPVDEPEVAAVLGHLLACQAADKHLSAV
ncbi:MAG TPA: hypothetical protein VN837_21400 [Chloroflexota bacterium]|nr:hypothetical protein [Chloroflexota bacterium]